jgi:hypothetical protein
MTATIFCYSVLPSFQILRYQDDPDEVGKIVEFRLVYRGKLPAASPNNTRNKEKHEIRCDLHRQLKTLWREHPVLHRWELPVPVEEVPAWQGRSRADIQADDYRKCDMRFLPLVNRAHGLACALDILFLGRDVAGSAIISGGDIDNRLKVLIDALKMPGECSQIPNNWEPSSDHDPFYCLMEDDSLITEIKITTDRLILPLEEGENKNDVVLIIHVKTTIVDHDKAYIEFY